MNDEVMKNMDRIIALFEKQTKAIEALSTHVFALAGRIDELEEEVDALMGAEDEE